MSGDRAKDARVFQVGVGKAVLPKGTGALPKSDSGAKEPQLRVADARLWQSGTLVGQREGSLWEEDAFVGQADVRSSEGGQHAGGSRVHRTGQQSEDRRSSRATSSPDLPRAERDPGYRVPGGRPLTIQVQLGLPAGPAP